MESPINELIKNFDELPDFLLEKYNSCDDICRSKIKNMLEDEVKGGKRRPWGSFEPFITALYHTVFILKDHDIGNALVAYVRDVCIKYGDLFTSETNEVCNAVIEGALAKLEEANVNSALNKLKNQTFSTAFSRLVKAIIIVDLTNEYNKEIDDLLPVLESNDSFLKSLFESKEGEEIAEHYLISELSVASEGIDTSKSFRGYFINRARRLQEIYKQRKKLVETIEAQLEEAKISYDKYVNSLSNNIKKCLNYSSIILFIGGIAWVILSFLAKTGWLNNDKIIAYLLVILGFIGTIITNINKLVQIPKIDPERLVLFMAKVYAHIHPHGRQLLKEIKELEITKARTEKIVNRIAD